MLAHCRQEGNRLAWTFVVTGGSCNMQLQHKHKCRHDAHHSGVQLDPPLVPGPSLVYLVDSLPKPLRLG